MIAFAIVFSILIIIALLRFGVSAEYSADGFIVKARVGPFTLTVLPRKEKIVSADKEARRKARKEEKDKKKAEKKARKEAKKEAEKETEEKEPGALATVLKLLPAVKTTLGRLRHRLLIKRLIIYYTIAGDDPYNTARMFGNAHAAIGAITPVLENSFRIKHRDFRAIADFTSTQQSIYINASISMAVWEAIYIVFAILPAGIRILIGPTNDRKDGHKNGQDTDS